MIVKLITQDRDGFFLFNNPAVSVEYDKSTKTDTLKIASPGYNYTYGHIPPAIGKKIVNMLLDDSKSSYVIDIHELMKEEGK